MLARISLYKNPAVPVNSRRVITASELNPCKRERAQEGAATIRRGNPERKRQ